MRYAGKPAAFLRGFRAVYLGLLMNCLILGWVTKAMTSIVGTVLGKSEIDEPGDLHFLSDSVHGILCFARRLVGRAVDRSFSVCAEDGHRDCGRVLRRAAARAECTRCSATLAAMRTAAGPGASRHHGDLSRFFARAHRRSPVDAAGADFSRAFGRAVVGVLVSGSGAGRRRVHCAADFQRAR